MDHQYRCVPVRRMNAISYKMNARHIAILELGVLVCIVLCCLLLVCCVNVVRVLLLVCCVIVVIVVVVKLLIYC